MKTRKMIRSLVFVSLVVCWLGISGMAQVQKVDEPIAAIASGSAEIRFQPQVAYGRLILTVSAPSGEVFRKEFEGDATPSFKFIDDKGLNLPDGHYTYELRVVPKLSREARKALAASRENGNTAEVIQELQRNGQLPAKITVQSGSFLIENGAVFSGAPEEGAEPRVANQTQSKKKGGGTVTIQDVVTADDVIIQGSACIGLDCVNNETFGFDTIRLKENNTRIQFDDTSTAAGFATNNWQIRANSSASGGASFLGFVDQGATGNSETGTVVFEVDAGAPANSLRVSSTGKVGLRTATPVLDLHITTSDTPAHRLEQTSAGGFTAQTWDIAGNEANFFVRDVTGGSRLPFRIRPGAPTSSIDISASGNVGIGTASPQGTLNTKGLVIVFDDSAGAISGGFYANPLASNPFTMWVGAGDYRIGTGVTDRVSGAGFTERIRILNANGRVGIGTAIPDQLLSVNGDASKAAGGGSWQVFSDERLKNIKGQFNSGLQAVMQLQPIRYQYRPDNALGLKSERENIGFGAQALQKIIPEAVTMNANGYLQVNNDPIIWTMLNAIKEQQKEIEQLKAQVRQLRATHRRK